MPSAMSYRYCLRLKRLIGGDGYVFITGRNSFHCCSVGVVVPAIQTADVVEMLWVLGR